MVSTCCIVYSPSSFAETALRLFAAIFSRPNNVDLGKRIIALPPDFVHADFWAGVLDFKMRYQ